MVKCEFFDMCLFKHTKNNTIKSWCLEISEIINSGAYCTIREEVHKILGKI